MRSVAAQLHADRREDASCAQTQRGDDRVCHALPDGLHRRLDHQAGLYKRHDNPGMEEERCVRIISGTK